MDWQGEALWGLHTKDLEAAHLFNLGYSDVVGKTPFCFLKPTIISFCWEVEVFVMAPAGECSYLFSGGSLILDYDEAQQTSGWS